MQNKTVIILHNWAASSKKQAASSKNKKQQWFDIRKKRIVGKIVASGPVENLAPFWPKDWVIFPIGLEEATMERRKLKEGIVAKSLPCLIEPEVNLWKLE